MSRLIDRVKHMLFGKPKDGPVTAPARHAADMQQSSKRRHEIIGQQAELERRLYFLNLEARADAGWHGPRQQNSNSHCG